MTNPRIYVACLASYNNGVLFGKWIDASADASEMSAEVNEMLAASRFPNVMRQKFTDDEGETRYCDASTPAPDDWTPIGKPFPSAEEFAIHDHEGLGDIGEYTGLDEIARRVAILEIADERDIPGAVLIEAMRDMLAADDGDAESFIDDRFEGVADSWKDFVQERADDCFDMSAVPAWLEHHIDWDSLARDWQLGGDWSTYSDGGQLYFFRTH